MGLCHRPACDQHDLQILPVLCRRPLVGYTAVALATVMTMVLGFGVWLHHMFATGLSNMALAFFSAVSLLIVIPSAVSFFAWIATIWTGRPVINTAFHFFAGFIVVFVIGGVSGFMTGSVPVDWQLTDTYFVVAHIHYVLIGWNLFAVMAAIYYWFPKMTGRLLNERLGRWNFWFMFVGFNLGFFPMHILGPAWACRGVSTPIPREWAGTRSISITTIGSYIFAFGIPAARDQCRGQSPQRAIRGPNPWDADNARMVGTSPPPPYNFLVIPRSRAAPRSGRTGCATAQYRSSLRRECRSTTRRRSWALGARCSARRSS